MIKKILKLAKGGNSYIYMSKNQDQAFHLKLTTFLKYWCWLEEWTWVSKLIENIILHWRIMISILESWKMREY